MLTAGWLMWVIAGNGLEPTVTSAQLEDIVAQDHARTKVGAMLADTALQISGSLPMWRT